MEKEISSGAMLGIVLIALAAVIGLGFGVFSIAKGISNEGVGKVQEKLAIVSQSDFDDYDDSVVSGTQVTATLQNFSGKSVAILVNTKAMDTGAKSYKEHAATALKIGTRVYVNYNALVSADAEGTAINPKTAGAVLKDALELTGVLEVEKDRPSVVKLHTGFAINKVDGTVQFDTTTGGMSRSGNCEYVSSTAKFKANLIKDVSETTVGIAFTQQ